jgi:SAM-dependent methyltransferase
VTAVLDGNIALDVPDAAQDIRSSVEAFARSLSAGSTVLDVGCGRRPYESFFTHCRYLGVDVEVSGRSEGDKQAHVFFDGRNLPFEERRFDAVVCTEVLEHAVEPLRLTEEMRRVLKPNGRLLVTVPFMWGEHEAPFDFRRFSTFGARRLLEEAGLRIVSLGKLTCGVDAINLLVQSEICNFDAHHLAPPSSTAGRWARSLGVTLARYAWAIQLRLWRRLYRFERVYIDNVIVAVPRELPPA